MQIRRNRRKNGNAKENSKISPSSPGIVGDLELQRTIDTLWGKADTEQGSIILSGTWEKKRAWKKLR